MRYVQAGTRLWHFLSIVVTAALLAGVMPGVAVAAPDNFGLQFEPTTAAGGAWVSSPVTLALNPGQGSQTTTITYAYSGASAASGVGTLTTFPGSVPVTITGETTVTLTAFDSANQQLETVAVPVKVDRVAPTINAALTPSTWTSQTVNVALSASDSQSGLFKFYYRIDPYGGVGSVVTSTTAGSFNFDVTPAMVSTPGTTTITYWATDNVSNTATKTASVLIDKTTPTTTSNRKASYVNTATITLTPSDAGGSGLRATYYQLNSGAVTTGTVVTTTLTTPATHSLRFWSVDNVGIVEPSTTVTFTVTSDAGAPVTTLVTKSGLDLTKWQSANVTFTLNATDTPAPPAANAGVANTYYRVDGGAALAYASGSVLTISKEGTSTVEYWSVDGAGVKETTKTTQMRIDKSLPAFSTDAKAEYVGTAAISISATDTLSGVSAIKWWIGSGSQTTVSAPAFGAFTFKSNAYSSSPGTQTLNYFVIDVAGNQTAVQSLIFHETRQPSVSIRSSSGSLANTTVPAKSTVKGTLLDGTAGVASKTVVLEYASASNFSGKRSVSTTTAADGTFAFNVSLSTRTFFRVRFAGDADNRAALSRTIWYKPRVALSAKAPTTATRGRAFSVTGIERPAHAKGRRVYVEWATKPGGKRAGYVWATITPKGSYSNYSARLVLKKGTWYVRAIAPDDGAHAWSASVARRVVVK